MAYNTLGQNDPYCAGTTNRHKIPKAAIPLRDKNGRFILCTGTRERTTYVGDRKWTSVSSRRAPAFRSVRAVPCQRDNRYGQTIGPGIGSTLGENQSFTM